MIIGSFLALLSVLVAAISQILLKISANKKHVSFKNKFCNVIIIFAYFLMLLSSFFSVIALRYLQLNIMPVFQATSFLWVPLLSVLILKERLTSKKVMGIIIIFLGVIIYLM